MSVHIDIRLATAAPISVMVPNPMPLQPASPSPSEHHIPIPISMPVQSVGADGCESYSFGIASFQQSHGKPVGDTMVFDVRWLPIVALDAWDKKVLFRHPILSMREASRNNPSSFFTDSKLSDGWSNPNEGHR